MSWAPQATVGVDVVCITSVGVDVVGVVTTVDVTSIISDDEFGTVGLEGVTAMDVDAVCVKSIISSEACGETTLKHFGVVDVVSVFVVDL